MSILFSSDNFEFKTTKVAEKELKLHVLSKLGQEVKEGSIARLEQNNHVYTGETKDNIEVKPFRTKETVNVRYKAPQAQYLEYGTGPAKNPSKIVNIARIEKWVNEKLGISGRVGKAKAIHIAKRIGQHGLKPAPFIIPTIYSLKSSNKRL